MRLQKLKKTAEATGDSIGNKYTDIVTSVGKSNNKQKKKLYEINETEEIYIPPEKGQQITNDLRLF